MKTIFLVGSDYVFPRTANKIIKAYAAATASSPGRGVPAARLTDFGTVVDKVKEAKPDAVFNTLNGDSNVAFFKEHKAAGLTAETMPVSRSRSPRRRSRHRRRQPRGQLVGLELLPDHRDAATSGS